MEPNRPKDEGFALIRCYPYCFGTDYPDTSPLFYPCLASSQKPTWITLLVFCLFLFRGGVCGAGNRLVVIVTAVPSYSTWILSDIHSDSPCPPTSDCLAFTNALINHTASNDSLLLPPGLITQLVWLEKVCVNIKTACWPGRNTEESGDPGMFNQPLAISEPNTLGLLAGE